MSRSISPPPLNGTLVLVSGPRGLSVREVTMEEAPARLDALSEMMALSSYGNTKNILVTAVEVKGPLDEEAMTLAIRAGCKGFPSTR